MDEEQRDYPAYIPDDWAAARARDYHYGAASASQLPQAPYVQDPDAWQTWAQSHADDAAAFTAMQADHDFTARESYQRTIEHDTTDLGWLQTRNAGTTIF